MRHGIKDYIRDTTIHRLRYLIDGRFWWEKVLWFIAVTISFGFLDYMLYQTIQDARENRLTTTLESIPVQEVPFPAVSLQPTTSSRWSLVYRLQVQALNRLEFDCAQADMGDGCTNRTSRLRAMFEHLIKEVISQEYNKTLNAWNNVEPQFRASYFSSLACSTDILLPGDLQSRRGLVDVARGIIADPERNIEQVLTKLAFQIFRMPKATVDSELESFVAANLKLYQLHEYKKKKTGIPYFKCTSLFADNQNRLSINVTRHIAAFVKVLGNGSPLLFGDFMKRYSYFLTTGFVEKTADITEFLDTLEEATQSLSSDNSEISIADVAKYIQASSLRSLGKLTRMKQMQDCDYHYAGIKLISTEQRSMCVSDEEDPCCKLEKALQHDKRNLVRVMKHGERLDTREQTKRKEADIDLVLSKFDFPLTKTWQGNIDPLISACKFGASSVPLSRNCSLMSTMYSNQDLVSTFNALSFWDAYNSNEVNKVFYSEMHDTLEQQHENVSLPRKAELGGPGYALSLIVNGRSSLGVHDPATIADMRARDETLDLQVGRAFTMRVTPSPSIMDDGVKNLAPESRKCLLPTESDSLDIFKWYTQSSCLFECQLKRAYDACGWTAWNYPHFRPDLKVCHGDASYSQTGFECFEHFMDSGGMPSQCPECLGSCEGTSYSYAVQSKEINYYKFCKDHAQDLGFPDFVPNQLLTRMDKKDIDKEPFSFSTSDICRRQLSRMSIVNEYISSKYVTNIKTKLAVTLVNRLADLGGIIGLFTGMSILSVVEIFMHLLRGLVKRPCRSSPKKQGDQRKVLCC